MGLMAQDSPWFTQLLPQKATGSGNTANVDSPSAREWLPFDLADVMEQGLACELTTRFEEPQSEELREMTISRSADEREQMLLGQNDQPLLIARARGKKSAAVPSSFDIFVAGDGQPPVALGPAFRLSHNKEDASWELRSACCADCEYRSPTTRRPGLDEASRTLMRLRQERCAVGPGFAMCLDVKLPAEGETWRSCCGTSSSAPVKLTSRRPKWSARLKSLTLDFRGRCNQASEKNFQLTDDPNGGGSADECVLQFGKMDSGNFCLDFRGPLGPVQAFAAALATASWK